MTDLEQSADLRKKGGGRGIGIALGICAIVAVVAAISIPVSAMISGSTTPAEAANEVRNLENAIDLYTLEYGRPPYNQNTSTDLVLPSEGQLIEVLYGYNSGDLNPREKAFFETKMAVGIEDEKPRAGVVADGSSAALYDPYGRQYTLVIDRDGDGAVTDPRTGKIVPKKLIIYSHGENPKSLADDVLSWD